MSKASAEAFSAAGFPFIGRSYDDMDCQEFVERCMEAVGIKKDLKGSNAWFREAQAHGWTGSPEECKKTFGSIPKGALLFIHAFDGGEEKRGYHDGKGNASHIGIKTGTGKGAIHSSASRGGVFESDFNDKTIRNGGWNMVGLWADGFTYGAKIDNILAGISGGDPQPEPADDEKEVNMYEATVYGGNESRPLNLRKKPEGELLDQIPQWSTVTVLDESGKWSKVKWRNKTGYMLSDFIHANETEPEPGEAGDDPDEPWDEEDEGETVTITLNITEKQAVYLLSALDELTERIAAQVGRG